MTHGKQISLAKRAAIIALHYTNQDTWEGIGQILEVPADSARKMFARIKKRAKERGFQDPSLLELLNECEMEEQKTEGVGQPEKVAKGSIESERMKEIYLMDEDHWQMTPPEIAKEAGLEILQSTAYRIMREHHNFRPYKPRTKPKLDAYDKSLRVSYATWALTIPQDRFIYTDEMWIEIGAVRRKRNVQDL
ncbi:hypothetical protein DFH27DRAFT_566688, partial [Peziza echinospora]